MSGPQKSAATSDLIPGIAAAATFLVLFFLHLMPVWLAALLGIGVYLGVKFLLPAPKPADVAEETTASILADVQGLVGQMQSGSARVRLRNIMDTSESLMRYGEAHPEKASDSLFVLRQYLQTVRTGVRRYLDTLRYTPASAEQSQDTLAELLETVHNSLKHLHSALVEKEAADLTGELRALNRTLQELDNVWVNVGDKKP